MQTTLRKIDHLTPALFVLHCFTERFHIASAIIIMNHKTQPWFNRMRRKAVQRNHAILLSHMLAFKDKVVEKILIDDDGSLVDDVILDQKIC